MNAVLRHDPDSGIIYVSPKEGSGDIRWTQSIRSMLQLAAQTGSKKALLDFRGAQITATASEIVTVVKSWPDDFVISSITDESNYEHESFVETASMNRGKMFRTFEDAEAAENWLKSC